METNEFNTGKNYKVAKHSQFVAVIVIIVVVVVAES